MIDQESVKKLQGLIAENNTESALQLLRDMLDGDPKQTEVVMFSSRIQGIRQYIRQGVVDRAWQCILPNQNNEEMEYILYDWATYRRRSAGFHPVNYNRYDSPRVFWEQVSGKPIFDLRLKGLVQRIATLLKEQQQKESEDE